MHCLLLLLSQLETWTFAMYRQMKITALFALFAVITFAVGAQNRVVISKPALKIFVISDEGDTLHRAPIACGRLYGPKRHADDWRTPEGRFKVKRISPWLAKTPELAPFGTCFMLIDTPGFTGIGMHGTNNPKSIGTRCSHGCIRMYNEDARKVLGLVQVGTPVTILPDTVGLYRSRTRNPIVFSTIDMSPDGGVYSNEVMDMMFGACEIKLPRPMIRKMKMNRLFED